MQRRIIDLIKKHKTIKLIHVFRQYSALSVVMVSAFIVTANNVYSQRIVNYLPGGESEESRPAHDRFKKSSAEPTSIASLPYVRSENALDDTTDNKIDTPEEPSSENTSPLAYLSGQVLAATANAMEKDPEQDGGVKIYTVQDGDTISGIASKNGITTNTILWANNIDDIDSIKPGDQIFILPVAGLEYEVKSGDTLDSIANKYKAQKKEIIAFNDLPANEKIEPGQKIVIPGGEKEVPKVVPQSTDDSLIARREYVSPSSGTTVTSRNGRPNRFPYGYCTWYVAQKKYVPWGGNAGTWLYHAKAAGYATGSKPRVGAIVVTTDSPYYGHVAIVEKVSGGAITVSEMNYKAWGKVNTRVVATASRSIKGYIY